MEAVSSSPERRPVTKTYLDRPKSSKRKRHEHAEESEESTDEELSFLSKKARTPSPIELSFNGPITKSTLKKVASGARLVRSMSRKALDLPGPEPRHLSHDPNIMSTPSNLNSKKTKAHVRSPSLSSTTGTPHHVNTTPSISTPLRAKKPPSIVSTRCMKPPSTNKRAGTPEIEMDDATSIAESAASGKGKRHTEFDRIQYLREQANCGEFGPHEAHCKKCGRSVKLGKQTRYTIRPWKIHRARCDTITAKEAGEGPESSQGSRLRLSVTERKAFLEADPNITDIQPDRVTCRKCKKIIKLTTYGDYKLNNWLAHNTSCDGSDVPSTRVETAARTVKLVNDPQVKFFDEQHVECAYCCKKVDLKRPGDFRLESWEDHKLSCFNLDRPPINEGESGVPSGISSVPFPSTQSTPPAASTTTNATRIAQAQPDTPASEQMEIDEQQGKKRPREDVDGPQAIDSHDLRPSNRARTSSVGEASEESPGALGWFMLPFHAFVRGFRESLSRG